MRSTLLRKLSPSEVASIRLAELVGGALFQSQSELCERLDWSAGKTRFVLDDWEHPSAAAEKVSASVDIVAICEALESSAKPVLLGRPNCSARKWLAEAAGLRREADLGWGGKWDGREQTKASAKTPGRRTRR